jgi:DNA-binding NtrC family response regulator
MARTHSILIVEDKTLELSLYLKFAEELGLKTVGVSSLAAALSQIANETFDFVLSDIHLTEGLDNPDGLSLIKQVQDDHPSTTVLAMSADPNVTLCNKAMEFGAVHFIRKPLFNTDEMAIALDLAKERRRLKGVERSRMTSLGLTPAVLKQWPEGIVISPEHTRLIERAAKHKQIAVVLYGETGTGKEEFAKLVHRRRCAPEGAIPLVPVNCANLSEELMVSMLFGHKKGSFSSADATTIGYVGEADGGILFLDEIHCLSRSCQQKLLRVLNDGTYQRLGDTKTLHAQFQVICATTKNLDDEVDAGNFLLDLRTRLTGIEIHIPPLRERMNEMHHFIELFFAKEKLHIAPEEFEKLVERCKDFYWRGNIRQLFKALEVLKVLSEDNSQGILAENLPVFQTMLSPSSKSLPDASSLGGPPQTSSESVNRDHAVHRILEGAMLEDKPISDVMAELEKAILQSSFVRHRHNFSKVCLGLQMPRSSLDLKRKKYGLD